MCRPDQPGRAERVPCAGAVVWDGAGRLLLVRRANPPAAGTWSLPGGRVEPGETYPEACRREVQEETGLDVEVGRLVGTVERAAPGHGWYEIRDFAATVRGGLLRAGDDASEADWFGTEELATLDTAPGLLEALIDWQLLGPADRAP